jgi:hypothetical protein
MNVFRGMYIASLIELLGLLIAVEVWRLGWIALP